ncbi:hypothetical protein ACJX0J_013752, partial [Zea mays]
MHNFLILTLDVMCWFAAGNRSAGAYIIEGGGDERELNANLIWTRLMSIILGLEFDIKKAPRNKKIFTPEMREINLRELSVGVGRNMGLMQGQEC